MKNQYFGDINDYTKYSLLRLLGGDGQLGMAVCWALTEDDSGFDGRRTGYLEQPGTWQNYDPFVFSHLREEVLDKGNRRVMAIEQANVLRNCRFFNDIIQDDSHLRDIYFEKFFRLARGTDFVFFDPDNGLGVKSTPRGSRGSSKYVYPDEVETAYNSGYSVLLYQHFPRKPREPFIRGLALQFGVLEGIRCVISYSSSHVVFLLLPQPHHEGVFLSNTIQVARSWGKLIQIKNHRVLRSSTRLDGPLPSSVPREVSFEQAAILEAQS